MRPKTTSQKGYDHWKVMYGYEMYISAFKKIKGLLIENEIIIFDLKGQNSLQRIRILINTFIVL